MRIKQLLCHQDEGKKEVQTSELSKEVQIQASRETEPEKQIEILKMASDEKKTVRDICNHFDGPTIDILYRLIVEKNRLIIGRFSWNIGRHISRCAATPLTVQQIQFH